MKTNFEYWYRRTGPNIILQMNFFNLHTMFIRRQLNDHDYTGCPTKHYVNGFKCLLPYIILDSKDFLQFISLTNSFTQIYFTLKSIFYKMTAMLYFLLFSFVLKNLTNCGRRHKKLFTNCHVSRDTL